MMSNGYACLGENMPAVMIQDGVIKKILPLIIYIYGGKWWRAAECRWNGYIPGCQ